VSCRAQRPPRPRLQEAMGHAAATLHTAVRGARAGSWLPRAPGPQDPRAAGCWLLQVVLDPTTGAADGVKFGALISRFALKMQGPIADE